MLFGLKGSTKRSLVTDIGMVRNTPSTVEWEYHFDVIDR